MYDIWCDILLWEYLLASVYIRQLTRLCIGSTTVLALWRWNTRESISINEGRYGRGSNHPVYTEMEADMFVCVQAL